MKFLVLGIANLLFFSSLSFAKQNPIADCTDANAGKVTVVSFGEVVTTEAAIALAYTCLSENNANLKTARAEAEKMREEIGEPDRCVGSSPLQFVELTSWRGDRPYVDADGNGTTSGEATYLVRENFGCSSVGTGLFGGAIAGVSVEIAVTELLSFTMDDDDDNTEQTVEIQITKVSK